MTAIRMQPRGRQRSACLLVDDSAVGHLNPLASDKLGAVAQLCGVGTDRPAWVAVDVEAGRQQWYIQVTHRQDPGRLHVRWLPDQTAVIHLQAVLHACHLRLLPGQRLNIPVRIGEHPQGGPALICDLAAHTRERAGGPSARAEAAATAE